MIELVRKIKDPALGEAYTEYKHTSGLTILLYPKRFNTAYAMLTTRYGSLDRVFYRDGEEPITVPDGVAHFLEHKMFEEEDGTDVFEKFAALGANANAFTSFDMTSYLFSATDHITELLEILISFVMHPHFTEENVEKEKGIIGQEIGMCDDRPNTRLYYSLLEGLYQKHNVRVNIAGTVASIAEITPDVLYRCYGTFYHPSNMILAVCSPVPDDELLSCIDNALGSDIPAARPIYKLRSEEPCEIASPMTELYMEIARPKIALGVKDNDVNIEPKQMLKRLITFSILLKLFFARSSPYFNSLYRRGLTDDTLDVTYETVESCAFLIATADSDKPEEALEELERFLKDIPMDTVSEEDFLRVKRVVYAERVRMLDSTESITSEMTDAHLHGYTVWDVNDTLKDVTLEDVKALAREFFKNKEFARVVIRPVRAEKKETV